MTHIYVGAGVMFENLKLREDGTIDCDYYQEQARKRRAECDEAQRAYTATQRQVPLRLIRVPRPLRAFLAVFALATAAFWATMATSPPTSEAAPPAAAEYRSGG
jgi:hypothetical protein